MASNIGTNAQFATTNMKPDNGEQIDSLWGQNIADNTGYVYYRDIPCVEFSRGVVVSTESLTAANQFTQGTKWFKKTPAHNRIVGSYCLTGSAASGNTRTVATFYSPTGAVIKGDSTPSSTGLQTTVGSVVLDISSLTNGSYYQISFKVGFTTPGAFNASGGMDFVSWLVA